MKQTILIAGAIVLCSFFSGHHSKPWHGKPQTIPGKLEFEWYDEGGEGIAFHDTDSSNNGSGKLNPANGDYFNEFRKNEAVDISYTKTGDIDDNAYNKVPPPMKNLYLGWTVPGEWVNYSILVTESGLFNTALRYTSNGDGHISFDLDGKTFTKDLLIPTTHDDRDTVAWRQWHHWNRIDTFCSMRLAKGKHVLKLHIVDNGNVNLESLEFVKVNE